MNDKFTTRNETHMLREVIIFILVTWEIADWHQVDWLVFKTQTNHRYRFSAIVV